jgi:hypothetical protein
LAWTEPRVILRYFHEHGRASARKWQLFADTTGLSSTEVCYSKYRVLSPEEKKNLCDLIREIFGNPFRPVSPIGKDVLSWNEATVVKLARSIYEEQRYHDMPILADALEDAGCTDLDILDHCRKPGVHARGCWLLDLLLERE